MEFANRFVIESKMEEDITDPCKSSNLGSGLIVGSNLGLGLTVNSNLGLGLTVSSNFVKS